MQRPPASSSQSQPPHGAPSGPVVLSDRYRIEREIGRGGMAVVSLAWDLKHERQVAVKFIGEQLGNAVGTQRFLQEIKLTASLQHPHVLSVYDSGVTSDNVLFYVMPYVQAGSLRTTLREHGPMSLRDVLRIAREVADALAFAHQRGIIHRDIKPENILFSDGHALVADFGIARLLTPPAGEQRTNTGVVMGTPAYMSPEQAFGLPLDARSDVYSLACVIWEMLTGQLPPVVAGVGWPPTLRGQRPDVPVEIEVELVRALSPSAEDRHPGTRALADALEGLAPSLSRTAPSPVPARRAWRGGLVAGFALALVALAGSAFFAPLRERLITLGIVELDSSRVLVASFAEDAGSPGSHPEAEAALRRELASWDGIDVVSEDATRDAIGVGGAVSLDRSIRAARQLRAGLLVRALSRAGATRSTIEAQAIDPRSGAVLATVALPLSVAPDALDGWATRAASLLLANAEPNAAVARAAGSTRSLAAWRAYARGQLALSRWDLRDAEAAFGAAVAADARFTAARVWLAQVLLWSRRSNSRTEWRRHAEEITTTGLSLDTTVAQAALALSALGRRQEPRACQIYRAMVRRDSLDAYAWLGLGDCQALDDGVVHDSRSPTGFVFRASWNSALRAYERAVRLSPGAHAALPAAFIERLLPAQGPRVRTGVGADDTTRAFAALPTALGDTVGYFPTPLVAGALSVDPPRLEEALQFNAARLLGYVTAWTQRAPGSVDAYEALAGVQEARGELTEVGSGGRLSAAAALDSARRLSTERGASVRLGASSVRILVKAGEFERARRLADSLLDGSATAIAAEAHWLAGVAALTGRIRDAARLARVGRTPPVDWDTLPAPLASAATLLLAQAAAGVCDDAFRSSPQRLEGLIDSYSPPAQRSATRSLLMTRARRLAVPCLGIAQVAALEVRSPWDRMQHALARGDAAGVKAVFDSMMAARRERRPGGTAADYIHVGAWTLLAAGDTARAERYADLTLNALPTLSRNAVWELTQSAALVRTFAWRAELANARGDRQNATRWAAAVVALWKNADVELQQTVERMRGIAESN